MNNKICYIIGAGADYGLDFTPAEGDLLIAADGGYARTKAAGLVPDLIIGDFDSLGHVPGEDQVVVLPAEKDVTDTWAAIRLGLERGYSRFWLYGCTGGRIDHTIANIQTAADLAEQGMECRIVDQNQMITALSGGTMEFDPECSGYVSVFAHSDRCSGVTLQGLKYELQDAELTNGFPLGVSNEFTGNRAAISVRTGTLIVVIERSARCRLL